MAGNDTLRFYYPWPAYGVKMSRQWPNVRENFQALAPLVRAAYVDLQPASAHDAGENDLSGLAIGERDFRNRFRTWYDSTNNMFKIQRNTGTEAVPVWSDAIQIRESDLRVIIAGSGGIQSSVGGFYSGTPAPSNVAQSKDFTLSREWVYTHSMDMKPILWNTFRSNGVAIVPAKVDVSDRNIAYFYFNSPVAGTAIVAGDAAGQIGVTFTDGTNTWTQKTRLGFNHSDFYLTPSNSGNHPVLNIRGSTGGAGVSDHGDLTGLTDDDHSQYLLASQATDRSTFTTNWADLTDGGTTTLHSHAAQVSENMFYAKMADGTGFGDTVVFADTDFNKSGHVLTVDETGLDHSQLANLTSGDPHTQYVLKTEAAPGFYGVNFRETDGTPTAFRNDTIYFDSESFYLHPNSVGEPIVSFRGSSGGAGVTDHGALTGLTDDDHSSYLLASDATSRVSFAANWLDLTDGGETSLHSHAAVDPSPGFYGIYVRESDGNPPTFRNDTLTFDSNFFYLTGSGAGNKPLVSIRQSGVFSANSIPISALSSDLRNSTIDANIGSTFHSTTSVVTSDGSTITLTYASSSADGLIRLLWQDSVHTQGAYTATLTAGTDASPTVNYAYITESTPTVITVNTTGFPSDTDESHVNVGKFLCQSAASMQTYGILKAQQWGSHLHNLDNTSGHALHVNDWIRSQPATWVSGNVLTATINTAPTPDTVSLALTAGVMRQLHEQTMPAKTDGTSFWVPNHPTAAYTRVTTMPLLTSTGVAIANNDRISVVVWANCSTSTVGSGETSGSKLFMNLPTAYYTSNALAIADDSRFTVYTIPTAFLGTAYLLNKLTYQYTNTGGGTLTLVENIDLRGSFPSITAGGSIAGGSTFLDGVFRIEDTLDATKELAFEVSGVTTGTTRTLTVQDRDGTIALTDQLAGQFYYLAVNETDGNPSAYRAKALFFDSSAFYLNSNSKGEPIVSLRGTSGAGSLTVKDIDGTPSISATTIQFTNGTVTDQGGGVAEVTIAAGGGISSVDDSINAYTSLTAMGFNRQHFYLTKSTTLAKAVVSLRDETDVFQGQIPQPTIENYFIVPNAQHSYTVVSAELDTEVGSCTAAFYIVSNSNRQLPGKYIASMDPIAVTTTRRTTASTSSGVNVNTMFPGDRLVLSIYGTSAARHVTYTVRLRKT